MLRPVSDPIAVETPSRRLRVASIYRSFNPSGSVESLYLRNAERLSRDEDVTVFTSAADRATTSAPLTGAIRFKETLGARRARVRASERGDPLDPAASAVKRLCGRGR